MVEHGNVYPSLAPMDSASLDLQLLGIGPLGAKPSLPCHVNEPASNLISTVDPHAVMGKGIDSQSHGSSGCSPHPRGHQALDTRWH